MPFADETRTVVLTEYRSTWVDDFASLAARLLQLDLAELGTIEHVGSTAVPGLIAKDVIDVQVRVPVIVEETMVRRFEQAGFRHRPEEWNNLEITRTGAVPKLVFAPRVGARPSNIHVRADGSCGARDALLFRDFLRADPSARDAWATFKRTITDVIPQTDLFVYGQIKQPAWTVLMLAADAWAQAHEWRPAPLRPWSADENRSK